jgi:tellurite resistance protein
MQQFGAVFGVAVVTAVFNEHGSLATSATVTSGYGAALAVSAGASLLGALVAVGIRRARASGTVQPVEAERDEEVIRELTPIGPR